MLIPFIDWRTHIHQGTSSSNAENGTVTPSPCRCFSSYFFIFISASLVSCFLFLVSLDEFQHHHHHHQDPHLPTAVVPHLATHVAALTGIMECHTDFLSENVHLFNLLKWKLCSSIILPLQRYQRLRYHFRPIRAIIVSLHLKWKPLFLSACFYGNDIAKRLYQLSEKKENNDFIKQHFHKDSEVTAVNDTITKQPFMTRADSSQSQSQSQSHSQSQSQSQQPLKRSKSEAYNRVTRFKSNEELKNEKNFDETMITSTPTKPKLQKSFSVQTIVGRLFSPRSQYTIEESSSSSSDEEKEREEVDEEKENIEDDNSTVGDNRRPEMFDKPEDNSDNNSDDDEEGRQSEVEIKKKKKKGLIRSIVRKFW
jgi:hypothetical protein